MFADIPDIPQGRCPPSNDEAHADAHLPSLSPVLPPTMNSVKLATSSSRELQSSLSSSASQNTSRSLPTSDNSTDIGNRHDALSRIAVPASLGGLSSISSPRLDRTNSAKPHLSSPSPNLNAALPSVKALSSELVKQQSAPGIFEDAIGTSDNPQWSSAVGKASLGKTGRVLEKLVGENDMLKRELNLERLKSEENRSAVKMVEARMDAQTNDYEARLHDAAVTKTLLRRRERQVTELKAQVDAEKARADLATEKEKLWREAMEQMQTDCQAKIAEATNKTMLFEGSYNTLQNHWKDKQAEHANMVARHRAEIKAHLERIAKEGEQYQKLHDLCDQLTHRNKELESDNDRLKQSHADYKETQDAALAGIRTKAAHQEKLYENRLREATQTMGDMRWVMNVTRDLRPDVDGRKGQRGR